MRPLRLVLETLSLRSSLAEQSAVIKTLEESNAGVEYAVVSDTLRVLRGSKRMRALLTASGANPRSTTSIRAAVELLGRRSADAGSCIDVELPDGRPGKLSAASGCGQRNYILVPDSLAQRPAPCLPSDSMPPGEKLTTREQQVIEQLATGSSNARIAEILCISVRTVENHLRSIYDKLGINSRTQLISLLFAQ